MSTLVRKLAQKGPRGVLTAVVARVVRPLHLFRVHGQREYRSPTAVQLEQIEAALGGFGLRCVDYRVDPADLAAFAARFAFPTDYHGGRDGGVYDEKLLEHFVAWDLLGLASAAPRWPYVDIAGASSPWAKMLRAQGLEAFSLDLNPHPSLSDLEFTIRADATASPFAPASIGSASLQCAYEMFAGDADTRLLGELARILRPGGRAVISPLYMHVEPCHYQSPEYFGRPFGDPGAIGYVRRDAWRVPTSRKYSAQTLHERVCEPARRAGLAPRLLVLRNKGQIGSGIYMHFILLLDKPEEAGR
jgi:SAM-dependent methyltransferase